jgi:hypothetical protein
VTQFRKQGYFLLTRDNLVAEVDTSLISPERFTLDPFEQARILAEAAEKKKQNPTCIVVIKQRTNSDSAVSTRVIRSSSNDITLAIIITTLKQEDMSFLIHLCMIRLLLKY